MLGPRRLFTGASIILMAILTWAGCDVIEDQSGPDDPGTDPPVVVEQVTETVGPAGGVLKVDGAQISLPSGALASGSTLTLARVESAPTELRDETVTESYTLTGLPDDFTGAIEIRLAYTGTLEDSSYVAFGTEVMVPSSGVQQRVYQFLPTAVTDSHLVALLPAVPAGTIRAQKGTAGGFLSLFGVGRYRTHKTPSGHFSIVYPRQHVQRAQAEQLGEFLEIAYTSHEQIGLSFAGRTRWPVSVEILKLANPDVYGLYVTSRLGDNYASLQFNRTHLNEATELRTTAAHELMHLAQYLYDPRWGITKAGSPAIFHWLNEAVAVWCEGGLSGQSNYVSGIRVAREMTPFDGMHAGAVSGDASLHGYGMSAFAKYMADKHGGGIVPVWYEHIKDGKHPVLAVNLSLDYKLFLEWEPFLRQYILGEIYGVETSRFMAHATSSFILKSAADTLEVFSDEYPDLSGKLYQIGFHHSLPPLSEGATMKLKIDAGLSDLTVFTYNGTATPPMVFHSHSTDSLVVANLKALQDSNTRLLVLVANGNYKEPYTNITPINLTAHLVELPSAYRAQVEWSVNAPDWEVTDSNGNTTVTEREAQGTIGSTFESFSEGPMEVQTNVHRFTATWGARPWQDVAQGYIRLTLDKDETLISNFAASDIARNSGGTENESFNGTGIPLKSGDLQNRLYEVSGPAACGHISTLRQRSTNFLGLTGELKNYNCNSSSYVRIRLVGVK